MRMPSASIVLATACLAATLFVSAAPVGTAKASVPGPIEPSFDWWMPDRYGIDSDQDGLVDMPNRASYVAGTADVRCTPECPPPEFEVGMRARIGDAVLPIDFPLIRYEWALEPQGREVEQYARHVPDLSVHLPEGPVRVTLRVVVDLPFRSFGYVSIGTIEVDDLFIVAIGDSYASGEGNPERRRGSLGPDAAWGDGAGDPAVEADHAAARRSSLAWPSQLAIDLERADRRTSVTFVSVAASGATVERGLLGSQSSSLPHPQVDRVAELAQQRRIDLLIVSIGGNDVGFSRLIAGLVDADPWLDPICYDNDLANIWASVADGHWDRASRLSWRITNPFRIRCVTTRVENGARLAGLDGLDAEYDRLAAAIRSALGPARLLISEYPDPTGHSDGETTEICDEIVGDAAPLGLHEINRDEQRLGRSEVLDPLNDAIRRAAQRHDWLLVGSIADTFAAGHGYCAEWPDYGYPNAFYSTPRLVRDRLDHPDSWYRNSGVAGTTMLPGPISWYRTAGQSVVLQGPASRVDTTGTMHPNELGHRALADLALAALEEA